MKVEVKSFFREVLFPYMVYTMFFLGIGMLSGSIVHMPLNPVRYSIILSLGIIVFTVASFLNETKIDKKNLTFKDVVRLIVFSLTLSIGIGMISGGIQHFDEEAQYAAKLIPIGAVISLFSFIIKNKISLNSRRIVLLLTTLLLLALPLSYGLNAIANSMPVSEDGHSHDNGHEHGEATSHESKDNHVDAENEKSSKNEPEKNELNSPKSAKDSANEGVKENTKQKQNANVISQSPKPDTKSLNQKIHTHADGETHPHTD